MSGFPAPLDPAAVAAARARLLATADATAAAGAFDATAASLAARPTPAWFPRAKFGIFVHWLVSSVPAFGNEWYPRAMYRPGTREHAHHLATYGPLDEFGHKDFVPRFTGARFDPDEWLDLVVRAGARYLVPVAEHHDGFSLGHTELSRWSASRTGPRRDVLGELAAAARRAGIAFGVSSHRAENWWFFDGGTRTPSDVTDPRWADLYGPARPPDSRPDRAFLDDWLARTVELVERYEPRLLYFDWWIEQPAFAPYLGRLAAYYYSRVPDGVIQYKWDAFPPGAAVPDIERGAVRTIQPRPFQNDTSVSRLGWAYLAEDDLKPVAEVLADLVDAVSKNGCLLLDIGPRPDGTVDPRHRRVLEGVGAWLDVHGEAVHDTRPWLVFGEGPTEQPAGSFVDTTPVRWTPADLRFTRRGDTLYATFLAPPADGVVAVRSLGRVLRLVDAEIGEVELLGAGPVPWERTAQALVARVPVRADALPGTLRIRLVPVPPPERPDQEIT